MSIETGVLVASNGMLGGMVAEWHLPEGRSSVALPDSRDLWDKMWGLRRTLLGFAHTHPGRGVPVPSWTDLTTFQAVESGLGQRLEWWIASEDRLVVVRYVGNDYHALSCLSEVDYPWLHELRRLSFRSERE